ncbi:unnamed protein product [Echinostoma caproni]|uniref:Presenilin n=1 Tax=Echinostoma caproni TaxID=27848 RepID=A0A183AB63_9TREM|nr:unnamed protein product [Echinostoma caproni]
MRFTPSAVHHSEVNFYHQNSRLCGLSVCCFFSPILSLPQLDLRQREERGVKLGLGDFVFYSLLIGRATLDGDAITVATCYVAILIGMCVTIIVLGITRRALPALPVSIACGILFYFVTSLVVSPFLEALAMERIFF